MRRIFILLPLITLVPLFYLTTGCSKKSERSTVPTSVPGPIMPALSTTKHNYVQGEEIVLHLKWPESKWQLVESQRGAFSSDEFWPFYVRINGEDFKIRSGLAPFSGLSFDWELSDDLYEEYEWLPGEYHVTYVLKGLKIFHPDIPESDQVLDEWRSHEVIVRITAVEQSPEIR